MIPAPLLSGIKQELQNHFGEAVTIRKQIAVGGGCINEAVKLETGHGNFFVKFNLARKYPQMFACEADGLAALLNTNSLRIPEVILHSEIGDHAFLILEFIEASATAKDFWHNFGSLLAAMHKNTRDSFGFPAGNYIGSLVQTNTEEKDFYAFFINRRLLPQLKAARDAQMLGSAHVSAFENLFSQLPSIIPAEKPALIHGDLWSGNFMADSAGNACIFDPAVSYNHREADIAMTKLFGGFAPEFYTAYHAVFPLEPGWQQRIDIFNLYPLLVHANLFGSAYAHDVARIIAPFRK